MTRDLLDQFIARDITISLGKIKKVRIIYDKNYDKRAKEKLLSKREFNRIGCWLWTGKSRDRDGRGQTSYKGKSVKVPRLSAYFFLDFDLSSKYQILHRNFCHNPRCFNPGHLYIGTPWENVMDRCYPIQPEANE